MIRGHGYLKYLKLFSIGFGISFFMGLGVNSVSAWEYVPCKYSEMVGDYATSGNCIKALPGEIVDISNYKFILNGGNITVYDYSTNNTYSGLYGKNRYNGLNITRNIYKNGKYVTLYKNAWNYSEPQYFMLSGSIACLSDDYNSCLWNSTSIGNIYYERDLSTFNGQSYDYVILPYTQQSTNAQAFGYCFHFPTLSGYLCFPIFQSDLSSSYTYTGITSNTFENTVSDSFPFGGGNYNNNGSVDSSIDTVASGDTSNLSCTWGDVLIVLETEGYNKYVCYGGLDNFDLYDSSLNYSPIAGQGLSIGDIRAWSGSRAWDTFQDWFFFWNGIYKDTSDNNYNAMWESYPAVYKTYFQLYNSYKGGALDPRTVLEYCQLRTLSSSLLNNSAGGYFRPVCETVINEKQTGVWFSRLDGTIYSGGVYTGDTPVATNWNGVGTLSGIDEQKGAVNFIQDFFNKAKSVIPTNYPGTGGGMLPTYIIMFMLALILFRFLSH